MKGAKGRRGGRPVIDFHAHVAFPDVVAFARDHSVALNFQDDPRLSEEDRRKIREWAASRRERMHETGDVRLRDMDEMGVDIQVVTGSLVHMCTYWADAETSLRVERGVNDRLAEIVAKHPDRYVALGGVPLQAPDLAVGELERCVKQLGLKGVQIGSRAGDVELGDARLRPFWAKAEALGAVVYMHPAGITDKRFQKHQLWNSVGQLIEETMAVASIMHEGVLDAFPKLKLCIAHGGGYMPYYTGRVDRNYFEKPSTRLDMSRSPSDYLKLLSYDSCVYDRETLEFLVHKVGADRIVMGSDYSVGELHPIEFVTDSKVIAPADKEKILSTNAARLLGIAL